LVEFDGSWWWWMDRIKKGDGGCFGRRVMVIGDGRRGGGDGSLQEERLWQVRFREVAGLRLGPKVRRWWRGEGWLKGGECGVRWLVMGCWGRFGPKGEVSGAARVVGGPSGGGWWHGLVVGRKV
jgi:hypothetical protein